MPKLNLAEETIPTEVLDALSVEPHDFDNALKRVQPSAMREVMVAGAQRSAGTMSAGSTRRATGCAKASSCR